MLASEAYGSLVAEALTHRLADLIAAATVTDIIAGRPQVLNDSQHMSVEFAKTHRLIFCPNHRTNPTKQDGTIDWVKVTRIKILRIEAANEE